VVTFAAGMLGDAISVDGVKLWSSVVVSTMNSKPAACVDVRKPRSPSSPVCAGRFSPK